MLNILHVYIILLTTGFQQQILNSRFVHFCLPISISINLKLTYRKKVFFIALNFLLWEILLIKELEILKKTRPPGIRLLKLI